MTTVCAFCATALLISAGILSAVFLRAARLVAPPGNGIMGADAIMFFANVSICPTTFSVNFVHFIAVIRIVRMRPIPQIFNMIHGKKSIIPEIPIS